jgi:hypothetical protein
MDIVEVVRHHNERVSPPRATRGRLPQVIHKAITIGVVTGNIPPPVAAGHEVINRTTFSAAQTRTGSTARRNTRTEETCKYRTRLEPFTARRAIHIRATTLATYPGGL